MKELLQQLLNRLEAIGVTNDEIYDTECRDRMGDAIFDGFIRPMANFSLPLDFGLRDTSANDAVRVALAEYINKALVLAPTVGVSTFHERLNAFQDGEVKSDAEGTYFDDFFGFSKPEAFDEAGALRSDSHS
jgi:hypothetical protein